MIAHFFAFEPKLFLPEFPFNCINRPIHHVKFALNPMVTQWSVMAVRVQMEDAKLQEFRLACMESTTIHPTTCLSVSNASKHVQLHPEATMILQFFAALTM